MSAPSIHIGSLDGDSITEYDSIILDEEDVSSIGNVSLIDHGLVDGHTAGHTLWRHHYRVLQAMLASSTQHSSKTVIPLVNYSLLD